MTNLINFDAIKMSQRQRLAFSTMENKAKLAYAMTFIGLTNKNLHIHRYIKDSDDKLPKVYTEKNGALNNWKQITRNLYNVSSAKKPTDSGDWYGVEIECYLPNDAFDGTDGGECDGSCRDDCECYEYTCQDCGHEHNEPQGECSCECTDYCGGNGTNKIEDVKRQLSKLKIKNIEVTTDGSLHGHDDMFGVEIKVLFKLTDYKNLVQVTDFLRDNNAIVDKSCGLHVHVDSRHLKTDEQKQTEVKKFADAMRVLGKMIPKSRRENTYCRDGYSFNDRYFKVNATALKKFSTIEIRAHSGTVSLTKIINWVRILDAVKKCNHELKERKAYTLAHSLGLTQELTDYMIERTKLFSPEETKDLSDSIETIEQSEVA